MNMIKKIAVTASTMLFVLAQIFSFYVIYSSQKQKIELIQQSEQKSLEKEMSEFNNKVFTTNYSRSMQDYVVIQCFRTYMKENSALFKGEQELFNNTPYDIEVKSCKENNMINCVQKKVNHKYILIFYKFIEVGEQEYIGCHVLDISYIYNSSKKLVIQEILISVLMSAMMAVLLIFLVKKITSPLQAINETQRQLIGSMSHELKTPLTAIQGYSETILNVKLSEEQTRKSLEYINTESARLSRLSEKMMELTKLYEPECRIELQKVSFQQLFEDVKNSVSHRLSEKEITLITEGNYKGLSRNLDKDLMTSFLINLINNSIMASEQGSMIFMGADETAVWVRDEGCGIPHKEIDKVRKAFYRVDKSRSRKSGNMGLGLALCDQIARVHGAKMKIESEAGKGTKISFVG